MSRQAHRDEVLSAHCVRERVAMLVPEAIYPVSSQARENPALTSGKFGDQDCTVFACT